MEKEINIAEILKDKPQGTKLYDWLYKWLSSLYSLQRRDCKIDWHNR